MSKIPLISYSQNAHLPLVYAAVDQGLYVLSSASMLLAVLAVMLPAVLQNASYFKLLRACSRALNSNQALHHPRTL
eukprot:1158418-Pelagomonas_calceolata.AAC.10